MEDAWHALRWIWAAIIFGYLAVQVIAAWRLDAGGKKRAGNVLIAVLVLMTAQGLVREVFENRLASRVGSMIVAVGTLVGSAILLRMLQRQARQGSTGIKNDSGDPPQSLNLS